VGVYVLNDGAIVGANDGATKMLGNPNHKTAEREYNLKHTTCLRDETRYFIIYFLPYLRKI